MTKCPVELKDDSIVEHLFLTNPCMHDLVQVFMLWRLNTMKGGCTGVYNIMLSLSPQFFNK